MTQIRCLRAYVLFDYSLFIYLSTIIICNFIMSKIIIKLRITKNKKDFENIKKYVHKLKTNY